jgi:hypothetical protein
MMDTFARIARTGFNPGERKKLNTTYQAHCSVSQFCLEKPQHAREHEQFLPDKYVTATFQQ